MTSAVLFVLLAVISFGLRLRFISDMEWNYDERQAVQMAGELLSGDYHRLLVGMGSSIGIPNPPGFIVIISSLKLILSDPLRIAMSIATINALAIILFAWYMRDKIGEFETWGASFLFASAPWAVIFSRKIWAQDLLAPFTVLLIIGFVEVLVKKRSAFWLLVIFSMFMLMQIHFSSIFLLPLLLMILMLQRKELGRSDVKYIVIGGGISSILFAPFALILLRNLKTALACVKASRIENMTFLQKGIDSVKAFIQSCTGLFYDSTLFNDYSKFWDHVGAGKVRIIDGVYYLTAFLLLIGALRLLIMMKSHRVWQSVGLMILCHAVFILFISSRTGLPYFVILYPVPFMMIALAVALVPWNIVRILSIAILVSVNISWILLFQDFIRFNNGSGQGYGKPYRVQMSEKTE